MGSIPKDKLLHFIAGFVAAVTVVVLVAFVLKTSLLLASTLAGVFVFALAGAKELYDIKHSGTFDGWDAYWTIAGGLLVTSALPFLKGFV